VFVLYRVGGKFNVFEITMDPHSRTSSSNSFAIKESKIDSERRTTAIMEDERAGTKRNDANPRIRRR
jgi:hypothetical protein